MDLSKILECHKKFSIILIDKNHINISFNVLQNIIQMKKGSGTDSLILTKFMNELPGPTFLLNNIKTLKNVYISYLGNQLYKNKDKLSDFADQEKIKYCAVCLQKVLTQEQEDYIKSIVYMNDFFNIKEIMEFLGFLYDGEYDLEKEF